MKQTNRAFALILAICTAMTALALAGCASGQSAQSQETSEQAENRIYMANLNQQVSNLGDALDEFQTAVAADDAVNLKAQAGEAAEIISQIKEAEAPERMQDIKDGYVAALETLDTALASYTSLYQDLQAGSVDSDAYASRLAEAQQLYSDGVDALRAADELLEQASSGTEDE